MNGIHGCQSHDGSHQVNIGEQKTTINYPPPTVTRSVSPRPLLSDYGFSFGSIISPDSEPNEAADPAPVSTIPPTMSLSEKRVIHTTGNTIQGQYDCIIKESKRLRSRCVIQLRGTVNDQRLSIASHIETISQWPEEIPGRSQANSSCHEIIRSRRDSIQKNLDSISKMLKMAVNQVSGLREYCLVSLTRTRQALILLTCACNRTDLTGSLSKSRPTSKPLRRASTRFKTASHLSRVKSSSIHLLDGLSSQPMDSPDCSLPV